MNTKKDRGRFSIKFNEKDPSHEIVIRMLEEQGPHSKAQFIANAVLHYIHCTQTPDIALPQIEDKTYIKNIVLEILHQQGFSHKYAATDASQSQQLEIKINKAETLQQGLKPMKQPVDAKTRALISDTLSAFRNNEA